MQEPGLPEDRDDRGLGFDEGAQVRIVVGTVDPVAGGAERGKARVLKAMARAAAKNSASLGFEPGQPPSM